MNYSYILCARKNNHVVVDRYDFVFELDRASKYYEGMGYDTQAFLNIKRKTCGSIRKKLW